MRFVPRLLAWVCAVASSLAPLSMVGCGAPELLRPVLPTQPTEQSKCKVGGGKQNPLVTEWPVSEKANLEARLREGGVVVAYSGCSMRLLPACRVKGTYQWRRTTTATDTVEVHDASDLYAKLPLGAASLEGELARSGRIAVTTTVAGQLTLTGVTPEEVPEGGACAGATHLLGAVSIGAFKLKSGGVVSAKVDVGVKGIGAGASTKSEETLVRDAGDAEACKKGTDQAPDIQCGSPIQVFLQALPSLQASVGPPGTIKVRFISAEADRRWEVVADDTVLCTTPCDRWLSPSAALGMRSEGGFLQKNIVTVPDLRPRVAGDTPLDVRVHGASFWRRSGGVVMTAFGGMGVAAGIALTAVGCSNTQVRGGMCVGGVISGTASVGLLVPGIIIIAGSGPHAEVSSPRDAGGLAGSAPARLLAGPGYFAGSF